MVSGSDYVPKAPSGNRPRCGFCHEREADIGSPGMGRPSCHPCKQSFSQHYNRGRLGDWIIERSHELATIWGGRKLW